MMKFLEELRHVLKGSCFTYTLAKAIGVSEKELLKELSDIPECKTRAYYSQEFVSEVLEYLGLEFELVDCFKYEYDYFEQVISEALFSDHKVLVCYNARKGAPLLGKKAVPETGHYCEILDIIGDTIRGRQSNVDGENMQVLRNMSLATLWEASCLIRGMKVNYGQIMNCKIAVDKHALEVKNRCGKEICPLTKGSRCRYYSDMGGVVIVIK